MKTLELIKCKRCGKDLYSRIASRGIHPLRGVCNKCITPAEEEEIRSFQMKRLLKIAMKN